MATHPPHDASELSKAHPIQWGLLWLCNVLFAVPLCAYLFGFAEAIYTSESTMPGWALGLGLGTANTWLKRYIVKVQPEQRLKRDPESNKGHEVKFLASLFAVLITAGAVFHALVGRPSWSFIVGGSAVATLSMVAVILLVPKTNYMIEAEQTS